MGYIQITIITPDFIQGASPILTYEDDEGNFQSKNISREDVKRLEEYAKDHTKSLEQVCKRKRCTPSVLEDLEYQGKAPRVTKDSWKPKGSYNWVDFYKAEFVVTCGLKIQFIEWPKTVQVTYFVKSVDGCWTLVHKLKTEKGSFNFDVEHWLKIYDSFVQNLPRM